MLFFIASEPNRQRMSDAIKVDARYALLCQRPVTNRLPITEFCRGVDVSNLGDLGVPLDRLPIIGSLHPAAT